jgi:Ni,Fe-hydrogenase I cytochrome b subunit
MSGATLQFHEISFKESACMQKVPEIKFWHTLTLWIVLVFVMLYQTEPAIYSPILKNAQENEISYMSPVQTTSQIRNFFGTAS